MPEGASGLRYYDQPYRGIPSEVRLMIWQFMIPSSIEMYTSTPENNTDEGSQSALGPLARSDIRHLNLLQINTEVRMEALEVMESSVILNCRTANMWTLTSGLTSLPAHIRAMMKGVRINMNLPVLEQIYLFSSPNYPYLLATLPGVSELEWIIDVYWKDATGRTFHLPEEEFLSQHFGTDDFHGSCLFNEDRLLWQYIIWAVRYRLSSMTVTINNLESNLIEKFLQDITKRAGEEPEQTVAYSRSRWENFQAQHGFRVDIKNNERHKRSNERNQLVLVAKRVVAMEAA